MLFENTNNNIEVGDLVRAKSCETLCIVASMPERMYLVGDDKHSPRFSIVLIDIDNGQAYDCFIELSNVSRRFTLVEKGYNLILKTKGEE